MAEVIDIAEGACGVLALRRQDGHFEVIADGVFLMDTRNGESERLLVTSVADELGRTRDRGARILLGGLGVGFSLRAALDHPAFDEVVVVEREPAVVAWNVSGPLREVHGHALADERVRLVEADLVDWLQSTSERFDAICLDIDNGPGWLVSTRNATLYAETGLGLLADRLHAGGFLSVWGAGEHREFTARLRGWFRVVRTLTVPVRRGEPDVIWLAHH